MPITQDRMLRVIAAARDYQRALDTAITTVQKNYQRAKAGQISWEAGLQDCEIMLNPLNMLEQPVLSATIIAEEKKHFDSTKGRNASAARYQQRKRREAGIPEVKSAPISISQFIPESIYGLSGQKSIVTEKLQRTVPSVPSVPSVPFEETILKEEAILSNPETQEKYKEQMKIAERALAENPEQTPRMKLEDETELEQE